MRSEILFAWYIFFTCFTKCFHVCYLLLLLLMMCVFITLPLSLSLSLLLIRVFISMLMANFNLVILKLFENSSGARLNVSYMLIVKRTSFDEIQWNKVKAPLAKNTPAPFGIARWKYKNEHFIICLNPCYVLRLLMINDPITFYKRYDTQPSTQLWASKMHSTFGEKLITVT